MRTLGVILSLLLGILAAPLCAGAQQPAKAPRIALLSGGSASSPSLDIDAFRWQLRELGYVEGHNVVIEYRYAEGRYDRFPDLAAELVRLGVDIIVTQGTPATRAAQQATTTIPIVMATTGDPVGTGLVASLARPGGNLTGSSFFFSEIAAKRLQLLRETVPGVTRVAVLWNPANPVHGPAVKAIEDAARSLAIKLQRLELRAPGEFDSVLSAISKREMDGLLVLEDTLVDVRSIRIADLAARSRLPTIFGLRKVVEAGGLMAYGVSRPELWRRAATFVDKILKGAKPADLPVEQATKFELVINMKTAKALGLTIPPSVLIRADQLIQ